MTRQEYYEKLCGMGLPELIAASMAAQTPSTRVNYSKRSLVDEVYSFQDWTKTKEGPDFWIWFKNSLP